MRIPAARIINPEAQEMKHEGIAAVVYAGPGLVAKGYKGKSNKPAFNYRFRNQAEMDNCIDRFFNALASRKVVMDERKAKKAAFKTSLVIGDILYSSWGYEQTNIDFYQVIAVTDSKKSVTIRPIKQTRTATGDMTGTAMPIINEFAGLEMKKKVSPGSSSFSEYLNLNPYASAWKWDGTPKSFSTYG